MQNNIASFDVFENDQQIAAHQAGLVRVVLEGDTDVKLFSRFWFPSFQETFEFIEAGRVATAGAGCTGVDDAVVYSRNEGIPAIGIVDRDTLFRSKEWELLFSIDATKIKMDWATTRIYVTSRWEVEAYLLEPDLLTPWVTIAHREAPASLAECAQALTRTLDACETLLAAAPFFASQHEGGKSVPPGFLYDQSLARVLEVCGDKIEQSEENVKAVATRVQELIKAIFDNLPATNEERLPFLLRYVDTKRLLNRLQHALKMREGSHWVSLAQFMLSGAKRPIELEEVLRSVEAGLLV